MNLTPDIVRAAWRALPLRVDAKVEDKRTSAEAKGIGHLLELAGRMKAADFMLYPTTIGDTIFLPFTPGIPGESLYDLGNQVVTLAHELTHVLQFQRDKMGFFAGYLADAESRALAECEAYRAGEAVRRFLGAAPRDAQVLSDHLHIYSVGENEITLAKSYFLASLPTLEEGGVMDSMAALVIEFLRTNG